MIVRASIYLLILSTIPSTALGAVTAKDIAGKWRCGPHAMAGQGVSVSAVDDSEYRTDGVYSEISTSRVTANSGETVAYEARMTGTWKLTDDIIDLQFRSMEILSTDNPQFTLERLQRAADEQMRKKNWSKHKVLRFGKEMVYKSVESMYKEAEIEITCTRAQA